MAPGLILLFFLAILCALFVHRSRRRMGMAVTGQVWVTVITGFVLIVLVSWVARQ